MARIVCPRGTCARKSCSLRSVPPKGGCPFQFYTPTGCEKFWGSRGGGVGGGVREDAGGSGGGGSQGV